MADYHPEETGTPPRVIETETTERSTTYPTFTSPPTPSWAAVTAGDNPLLPPVEIQTQLQAMAATIQTFQQARPPPPPDPNVSGQISSIHEFIASMNARLDSLQEMFQSLTKQSLTDQPPTTPSPTRKKMRASSSDVPPHPGTPTAEADDEDEDMTNDLA